jgi:DNA-binding transcriptional ArsR family regulator
MYSGDADISVPAALMGERARAALVVALTEVDALAASELARLAGVSNATASVHLAKLLEAGLLAVEPEGRHRYYRLASPEVARAVEALAVLAPSPPVRSLREATVGEAIRAARTCYDHLAGRLGVALTEALLRGRLIRAANGTFELTSKGPRAFTDLGIDLTELERSRRALMRSCMDWSERRSHLAGALGAALTERMLRLRWIRRLPTSRAVRLTHKGETELRKRFAVYVQAR